MRRIIIVFLLFFFSLGFNSCSKGQLSLRQQLRDLESSYFREGLDQYTLNARGPVRLDTDMYKQMMETSPNEDYDDLVQKSYVYSEEGEYYQLKPDLSKESQEVLAAIYFEQAKFDGVFCDVFGRLLTAFHLLEEDMTPNERQRLSSLAIRLMQKTVNYVGLTMPRAEKIFSLISLKKSLDKKDSRVVRLELSSFFNHYFDFLNRINSGRGNQLAKRLAFFLVALNQKTNENIKNRINKFKIYHDNTAYDYYINFVQHLQEQSTKKYQGIVDKQKDAKKREEYIRKRIEDIYKGDSEKNPDYQWKSMEKEDSKGSSLFFWSLTRH